MSVDRYVVHDSRDGVVCGMHMDGTIPKALRYWVAVINRHTMALGSFICATQFHDEAKKIADALTLLAQAAILVNKP